MISWARAVADLRKQVAAEVKSGLTRLFGFTLTASTSSMGDKDAMQLSDVASDGQRPVQRIEPFGLRSRPVAKLRGLWLRLGSSNVAFIGIMPSQGYGPVSLEEGETALYSENIEKGVLLNKAGDVALESKVGQVVSVNGTDYSLPKWDDFIGAVGGLKTFLSALKTDLTAANSGSLVDNPAIDAFLLALTDATDYKSDKAKNG